MTIAYLIDYDLHKNSGVIEKIKQQALAWHDNGQTVYFVSLKTMSIYDIDLNTIEKMDSLKLEWGRFGTAINLLYNSYFINKLIEQIEFDVIYMRYRLYMPFFNKVVKKYKIIMEINSDDTLEYKLHSFITNIYNKLTRNYLLKHIDGFIAVSYELKGKFLKYNKSIEVIANGIDVKQYDSTVKQNNKPIKLVFIGTPNQAWHGLDKIIEMANYFKKYQFYIIGTDGEDRENIHYLGYLSNKEATKVISQCDIGIGTLSLYKTGLQEASPLKTRQYLACGLPIIYAYKDTDINKDVDFALRLENKENNIEHKRIEEFVQKVFGNSNATLQAKEFAKNVLSYEIKEKKRLNFFERILNEN